jgi:ABC-2 type transport system permease protein
MTRFILKILDLFRRPFEALNVDYPKFRELLWVKLTIDNRQEKSVAQRKSGKEISKAMIWVMVMYAFLGIFAGLLLAAIPSLFTALIFIQAMIMIMTAVALISDFSSVLLDTTDNAILQFRPIDDRTMAVARIVHIFIYLLMITLSLSLGTLIIGTIKYGLIFSLTFPVSLIFSVLFIVFLSNIFYLLLIKVSGEERFRDVILYFQIFMAVLALGSYQILPRLLEASFLKNFAIEIKWWTFLIPPAWIAAPVEAAVRGVMSKEALLLTLIGVGLPVLLMIVVVKFLAPGFNKALLKLEKSGPAREKKTLGGILSKFFSRLTTFRPVERAAFEFVWLISGRDRKFKMKTYPNLGYFFILAAFMTLRGKGGIVQALRNLPDSKSYLVFLYVGCVLIPMTLFQIRASDQFQAAWIYRALPVAKPGEILKGAVKAVMMKFGGGIFFLLSILTLFIWGPAVIDDIGLAFVNMIFITYALSLTAKSEFPFSRPYGIGRDAQQGIKGIFFLILPLSLGFAHYGLTFVPFGTIAAIPVIMALIWPVSKIIDRTPWAKIPSF